MNKKKWSWDISQALLIVLGIILFRYNMYAIEREVIMPSVYVVLIIFQFTSFIYFSVYILNTKKMNSYEKCVPWVVNLMCQIILFLILTTDGIKKIQFYIKS